MVSLVPPMLTLCISDIMVGWLCKIKMADGKQVENLMDAEAYKKHCEGGSD